MLCTARLPAPRLCVIVHSDAMNKEVWWEKSLHILDKVTDMILNLKYFSSCMCYFLPFQELQEKQDFSTETLNLALVYLRRKTCDNKGFFLQWLLWNSTFDKKFQCIILCYVEIITDISKCGCIIFPITVLFKSHMGGKKNFKISSNKRGYTLLASAVHILIVERYRED